MKISNHVLKLQGKAESPKELEIGFNYHVALEGSIPSFAESDNEDGTHTRIYTFKPVKIDLLDQKGETIKMKDTRSNSQLIRALVYKKWVNAASAISFDECYDMVCREIMLQIDRIMDDAERHQKP